MPLGAPLPILLPGLESVDTDHEEGDDYEHRDRRAKRVGVNPVGDHADRSETAERRLPQERGHP